MRKIDYLFGVLLLLFLACQEDSVEPDDKDPDPKERIQIKNGEDILLPKSDKDYDDFVYLIETDLDEAFDLSSIVDLGQFSD